MIGPLPRISAMILVKRKIIRVCVWGGGGGGGGGGGALQCIYNDGKADHNMLLLKV